MIANFSNSLSLHSALWSANARRSPENAYLWGMAHRRDSPRPMLYLPYMADLAADDHPFIVIQKSAQTGVSEFGVTAALHAAETGYAGRGGVLYLMQSEGDVTDFVQTRIDPVIDGSPYLRQQLQLAGRRKTADNTRVKLFAKGAIHFRGALGRQTLSSIPVDLVIIDEYDIVSDTETTLTVVRQRLASSARPRIILISTPRLPESGINAYFLQSDQRHYYIPCPGCQLEQDLRWPENVDIQRRLVVCRVCGHKMNLLAQGRWIPTVPQNTAIHGYHLNRLYSPWLDLEALIFASEAPGIQEQTSFHNADLGEPFVPSGSGLTLYDLHGRRLSYSLDDYDGGPCVMGVDVGSKLHVVVRQLPSAEQRKGRTPRRLWHAEVLDTWEELEALMFRYDITAVAIDQQPELHKAREFAQKYDSRAWLVRYDRDQPGFQHEFGKGSVPNLIHANRTELISETFERFRTCLVLPRNAQELGGRIRNGYGDYFRQLLALKRRLEPNIGGNVEARWDNGGKDDHFAHAECYALLAEKVAGKSRYGEPVDIRDLLPDYARPGWEPWRPAILNRRSNW